MNECSDTLGKGDRRRRFRKLLEIQIIANKNQPAYKKEVCERFNEIVENADVAKDLTASVQTVGRDIDKLFDHALLERRFRLLEIRETVGYTVTDEALELLNKYVVCRDCLTLYKKPVHDYVGADKMIQEMVDDE